MVMALCNRKGWISFFPTVSNTTGTRHSGQTASRVARCDGNRKAGEMKNQGEAKRECISDGEGASVRFCRSEVGGRRVRDWRQIIDGFENRVGVDLRDISCHFRIYSKMSSSHMNLKPLLYEGSKKMTHKATLVTNALTNHPINSATKRAVVFATAEFAFSHFPNFAI